MASSETLLGFNPWIASAIVVAALAIFVLKFIRIQSRFSKSEMAFGNRMASSIEIGRRVVTGGKLGEVIDIAGPQAVVQLKDRNGNPFTVRRSLDRLEVVS